MVFLATPTSVDCVKYGTLCDSKILTYSGFQDGAADPRSEMAAEAAMPAVGGGMAT